MQYAERLPSLPSPNKLVAPLAALALGAAVATGAYALIDNDQVSSSPSSKVIVVDSPATPSEGVSAKNEAGTAAAISTIPAPSAGVSAKNEAGTAAAIRHDSGSERRRERQERGRDSRRDQHDPGSERRRQRQGRGRHRGVDRDVRLRGTA